MVPEERSDAGKPAGVEAPYLQLVMTRIWEKEQDAGSAVLRAATLDSLGGAETIVRDHLGEVMAALSEKERGICVHMFQHLVTPSGARIAHSAADLAEWAGEPKERVEHLLRRLSGTPMRILVTVAPVDAVGAERYEIYHDALGQAMLDWRERRVAEEQRAEIARWRQLVVALVVAMIVALVAVGFAWIKSKDAKEKAALAAEKELEAQKSAQQATATANQMANLAQELQTALAEKEEKEAQLLDLQGKSDEAEKLRADAAERKQRMREILNDFEVGAEEPDLVAAIESRLQAVARERDEERTRAERAEGQLADALARIQDLERQVDDLKPSEIENEVGMRFRRIRAGTFHMGSQPEELGRHDDERLREVTLTRDFWMAETEVTQGQWKALIGNNPSSYQDCGADCPVERVNWFEALEFANRLSEREGLDECYTLTCSGTLGENLACPAVDFVGLDCQGYRLPTEAEWEYAARAGTTTPFWTGDNLTTEQANYNGNFPYGENPKGIDRKEPVAARSFDPNPWGLYEVHGDVWEWVWEWYGPFSGDPVIDPIGTERGSDRVIRGGGWFGGARNCRAARRDRYAPGYRNHYLGFRLVRTYP